MSFNAGQLITASDFANLATVINAACDRAGVPQVAFTPSVGVVVTWADISAVVQKYNELAALASHPTVTSPTQGDVITSSTLREMYLNAPNMTFGPWPHKIEYSALFDGASDYLSWTPSTDGNRKTFTLRFCMKSTSSIASIILSTGTFSDRTQVVKDADGRLSFQHRVGSTGAPTFALKTASPCLDESAFYDVVVVFDSTNPNQEDRVQIWTNGVKHPLTQVSVNAARDYPNQNEEVYINAAGVEHRLCRNFGTHEDYVEGHFSELIFIAGLALTPISFGEFSSRVSDLWLPQKYSGEYGVNGFHLNFADATSLGKDTSGNGNHWAVHGAPVQTLDTPTNNFSTLNAHDPAIHDSVLKDGNIYLDSSVGSYGMARSTLPVHGGKYYVEFEQVHSDGMTVQIGAHDCGNGTAPDAHSESRIVILATNQVKNGRDWSLINLEGDAQHFGTGDGSTSGVAGEVWAFAIDGPNKTVQVYREGIPVGNPTAWVTEGPVYVAPYDTWKNAVRPAKVNFGRSGFKHTPPEGYKALCSQNLPDPVVENPAKGVDVVLRAGNCKKNVFVSGIPTASCTYIATPSYAFDEDSGTQFYIQGAVWREETCSIPVRLSMLGAGGPVEEYSIALNRTGGTGGPGDFDFLGSNLDNPDINNAADWDVLDSRAGIVWSHDYTTKTFPLSSKVDYKHYALSVKGLEAGYSEVRIADFRAYPLSATVSGLGFAPDFVLIKNRDSTHSWNLFDTVRGPNKNLKTDLDYAEIDLSGTEPNDQLRSFSSDGYTLGANNSVNGSGYEYMDLCLKCGPEFGFDIVQYTGDGVAGRQVAHNCGGVPEMMVVKCLSNNFNWAVYHKDVGPQYYLVLNSSGGDINSGTVWNGTSPDNSSFTVGAAGLTNNNGEEYIAYVFRSVPGFSKVFSYEGNGSTDGAFVNLGFTPLATLVKNSTVSGNNWCLLNTEVSPNNYINKLLTPSDAAGEYTGVDTSYLTATSGGFKVSHAGTGLNGSGHKIVGIAWAAQPLKYSNAF